MAMPAISVFVPLYNTEQFIANTINSVRKQSFSDWELIIVDDCSTDGSYKICEEIAKNDSRIRLFKNEVNLGMMRNWNKGLSLCRAPYVAKLDGDDWWHKNMLADCFDILEKYDDVGLVVTRYAIAMKEKTDNMYTNVLPEYARNKSFTGVELVRRGVHGMFADGVLKQGIGLIKKTAFETVGPFSLIDSGDTEMWFRIASRYRVYGIDKVYYYYRVWENSFSNSQILGLNKRERNLFETRETIITYYFQNHLISATENERFLRDNNYEYNKHLIYKNRMEGKLVTAFQLAIKNLTMRPLTTMTFYLSRMVSKLKLSVLCAYLTCV
jgi:glycosyltransferase involved in cell wall biosynthesis